MSTLEAVNMVVTIRADDSSEGKQLFHHEAQHFTNQKWFIKTYLGCQYDTTI